MALIVKPLSCLLTSITTKLSLKMGKFQYYTGKISKKYFWGTKNPKCLKHPKTQNPKKNFVASLVSCTYIVYYIV